MIRNVTKLFSLQSFPPKQNVSFLDKKDIQVFKEREREKLVTTSLTHIFLKFCTRIEVIRVHKLCFNTHINKLLINKIKLRKRKCLLS